MAVHPNARVGFQRAADRYDRGRPETPPAALEALVQGLGISPRSAVLELGAGTGKLTRLLAPRASLYVAIEPVPAMRERFRQSLPETPLLGAVAELLPLQSARFDAVVAAQAFHWFDAPRAMGEMHRVLRPGGSVGLLWNVRDESVDWVRGVIRIFDRYDNLGPRFRTHGWYQAWTDAPEFEPLQKQVFPFVQRLDRVTALDQFLSVSFIASLEEHRHAEAEAALRDLLDTHPQTAGRSEVELPYLCEVYTTRSLAARSA